MGSARRQQVQGRTVNLPKQLKPTLLPTENARSYRPAVNSNPKGQVSRVFPERVGQLSDQNLRFQKAIRSKTNHNDGVVRFALWFGYASCGHVTICTNYPTQREV